MTLRTLSFMPFAVRKRRPWRRHILYNGNLESICGTPEFAAIVAEIEADMAQQLARVREMRKNEESEPVPELAAE